MIIALMLAIELPWMMHSSIPKAQLEYFFLQTLVMLRCSMSMSIISLKNKEQVSFKLTPKLCMCFHLAKVHSGSIKSLHRKCSLFSQITPSIHNNSPMKLECIWNQSNRKQSPAVISWKLWKIWRTILILYSSILWVLWQTKIEIYVRYLKTAQVFAFISFTWVNNFKGLPD
jgi:hypothetical protein